MHWDAAVREKGLLAITSCETAVSASLAPVKEGQFPLPGREVRPADLLIPRWAIGKDACLDFTVVSSLQRAMMQGATTTESVTDGFALQKAFDRKIAEAGADCRQAGLAFMFRKFIPQPKFVYILTARILFQSFSKNTFSFIKP